MRLFGGTCLIGSALLLGATAAVQAQTSSYYGTSPYNTAPAYGAPANASPSLLPLPSVTPAGAYGPGSTGLRPVAAVSATEAPYQSISPSQLEPLPSTTPDIFSNSPSDPAGTYGSNAAAPNNSLAPSSGCTAPAGASPSFAEAIQGACGGGCGCGAWFGSVGGIAMTRNNADRFWTSYQTNNNPNQLMNTDHAHAGWGGGGEVTAGRWFAGGGGGAGLLGAGGPFGAGGYGGAGGGGCGSGCGCGCGAWGIAATYWGISPLTGNSSVTDPTNNISTPIDVGNVNITNSLPTSPNPASYFFDNSPQHTLSRVDRINNVEINFLDLTPLGNGRTQAIWLAGVRYFRFDETMTFGSVAFGHTFSESNGAYSAFLRNTSVNNLIGPQIGVQISHYITPRFGVYATPKFGIYGNYGSSRNTLYTGDGFTQFDLKGNKTDFSTIGQIDLGMNYLVCPRLSVYGGYRLLAVNQVILSDNQFLPFLADTQGFQEPKSGGSLLLHGAFAGLAYTF
jgi:hypothetical protein